jgi:hypothetical protein
VTCIGQTLSEYMTVFPLLEESGSFVSQNMRN